MPRLLLPLALLAACNPDPGDGKVDTAPEGHDTAEDTGADTAEDTAADTGDTGEDTGADTAADTGDTGEDTGTDTGEDTAEDTGDTAEDTGPDPVDADGDGHDAEVDCDDTDATVFPGADERCDGVDDDCDGLVDDDPIDRGTFYVDADGDGHGDPATAVTACAAGAGQVSDGTDCDDTDDTVFPGADEVCDDADADEDCDGLSDDADTAATGTTTWYRDADGDTFGNPAVTTDTCDLPAGYVPNAEDCDDAEGEAWPGNVEVCDDGIDQDCSGGDEACPHGYTGELDPDDGYTTKLYGIESSDAFGAPLVAGDFDGDGAGDLVVGAENDAYWFYDGTVYGYYGPFAAGAHAATDHEDFLYYGTSSMSSGLFGTHLWNVGDLDGDGDDDLLVAKDDLTHYLFYGGDAGVYEDATWHDGTHYCTAAARAGDFTAPTGTDDWLCAITFSDDFAGATYIQQGTSSSSIHGILEGEAASDVSGTSVAGGHDVDGDGHDDAWIGAPGNDAGGTSAGAAYLVYAPVTGTLGLADADAKLHGAASDQLGTLVTMPGDLDGDGHADLVAVAPYADGDASNAGAVYVFTAPASGAASTVATATMTGEGASDSIGSGGVSFGDFDGDGVLDLLVGAEANDGTAASAGAAYLLYGPLAGTISASSADATWRGGRSNDQLGSSVAAIPDTDGDGKDELALGARYGDHGASTNMGAVWIFPGL